MTHRHLFRSVVLQSLFEIDFKKADSPDQVREIFERNIKEFAPDTKDISFMENLFKGVFSKKEQIDDVISKAASDWPLEKISIVDRNILRIGLYELLFADKEEVPPKVAINEAIELAKSFGGENSGKFVNGVLGTVYKELGEPGKDDTSKKRSQKPDEALHQEFLGGGVVYAKDAGEIYLALVHDVFGHWTLSKGKIKSGEDLQEGTKKKIEEEIGLKVEIEKELKSNQYVAYDPEKGKIVKNVKYFLARAPFADLKLGESGGLDDAKWFKLKDILDLNFYDDIMPIVTEAIKILLEKSKE